MYAIDYDFEQGVTKNCDFKNYNRMLTGVKKVLNDYGFKEYGNSFYVGYDNIDAISAFRCVIALNELTKSCNYLQSSIKDIRIIEIDKDSLSDIRERA